MFDFWFVMHIIRLIDLFLQLWLNFVFKVQLLYIKMIIAFLFTAKKERKYWFVLCCYHVIHKPVNIELYFESTAVT